MTKEELIELKSKLLVPRDVVILSHRNPDGDAVGSSIGLAMFLRKMLHQVKIVVPSEYPSMLDYLPSLDSVEVFDLKQDECRGIVDKAQIIFLLDFNSLDRIDKLGINVQESKATKIMIDHHLDPEPVSDYLLSDTEASSTCELVYQFITDLGFNHLIDDVIGKCLFTGLITDTGSFRYATRPQTYEVASQLKKKGVDDYSIQNNIYNSLTAKQLQLLGHCLANRFHIIEDGKAAYIFLNKKDYANFAIGRGDTEGIVNYMLMVKEIQVAAFITEQPSIIKISLRSKGNINVQELASNHFNGGGHKNASGGSAYGRLSTVINTYKENVGKYLSPKN